MTCAETLQISVYQCLRALYLNKALEAGVANTCIMSHTGQCLADGEVQCLQHPSAEYARIIHNRVQQHSGALPYFVSLPRPHPRLMSQQISGSQSQPTLHLLHSCYHSGMFDLAPGILDSNTIELF